MAKSMTTSQIDRACEILRAKLTKHASEFSSDAVQMVFGQSELGAEWLAVLRKRVEAISSMIIRRVKVDPTRSPEQVIDATNRAKYTDGKVVKSMPRGTGEETDIHFFKVGRFISDNDLEKEYELRGLRPADPESLAKVNEDDPAFADSHPNGTHWKDADGKWCFANFDRWSGKRSVDVVRYDNDWDDYWWFAGVCK
jgi:hypothetical protein